MAQPLQPRPPKARNPRTQTLNRRDSFWQIMLPVGLAVIAAVFFMVLAASPGAAPTRSVFADVSLIFLILPTAVWGFVLLALIIGMCVGLWYGLRELPYLFKRAQDFVALVAREVKKDAAQIAGGVMSAQSVVAAAQRAAVDLRALFTPGRSR